MRLYCAKWQTRTFIKHPAKWFSQWTWVDRYAVFRTACDLKAFMNTKPRDIGIRRFRVFTMDVLTRIPEWSADTLHDLWAQGSEHPLSMDRETYGIIAHHLLWKGDIDT